MQPFRLDAWCDSRIKLFLSSFGNDKPPIMARFVAECAKLGLPLNAGKAVLQSFSSSTLGGQFDGINGILRHAPDKGHAFLARVVVCLAERQVTQVFGSLGYPPSLFLPCPSVR